MKYSTRRKLNLTVNKMARANFHRKTFKSLLPAREIVGLGSKSVALAENWLDVLASICLRSTHRLVPACTKESLRFTCDTLLVYFH